MWMGRIRSPGSGRRYTLTANVEELRLTGAAVNGWGNDGDNVLYGNSANNTLSGGNGKDTLQGDKGHDFLYGEGGDDTLFGNEGNDYLAGGEGSNDVLYGGTGDDTLLGNDGEDDLWCGPGNDLLCGGHGEDFYYFKRGDGIDEIREDWDPSSSNTLVFVDVSRDEIWTSRSGNDLNVFIRGTADQVVIRDAYAGGKSKMYILTGQRALPSENVDKLVQAMAAFTPSVAGQTSLRAEYQTAVAPVLAVNWQ